MIHSFTPSPHQTPRPTPPRSPLALTVKTSPKSPQSPKSLESHNSKGSASFSGAVWGPKPAVPPNKVDSRPAPSPSVQTAPSRCYVPRSAQNNEAPSQPATVETTSAALAEVRGPEPWSRISASRDTPTLGPPSVPASSATATARTIPADKPVSPASEAAAVSSTVSAVPVAEASTAVPKAAPTVSAEPPPSSTAMNPLPSPLSESTPPAAVTAPPDTREQSTKVGQSIQTALAPQPNMLPTPVTPATRVPPSMASASTQTLAPAEVASELPKEDVAEPGLFAPRNPPVPLRLFLSEGLQSGTHMIVTVSLYSAVRS